MAPPRLIFIDRSPPALEAWRFQLARWPEVEVLEGDVLEAQASAFLLPGNSFGFLDSGLELRVAEALGPDFEEELRGRIRSEHHGELLVGQALVMRPSGGGQALVYSPLWRTPRRLAGTIHPYLCLRAALLAAMKPPGGMPLESLAVPALTGLDTGALDPRIMARQTRYAYEVVTGRRGAGDKNLSQLTRRERKLQSIPGEGGEGG